jgi:hypothetical protein
MYNPMTVGVAFDTRLAKFAALGAVALFAWCQTWTLPSA